MTATRHDDGSNDRRIGVPTTTTFPAELIARIAPAATNRQRHTRATRSGARDPAGQGMAGPQPAEMPDDRYAGEIQVAQGIDQLVADKLVGEAQPAIVQHPVPADHDGVVERAAACQPGGLETRPIVEQPEGA